MTPEHDYSRAGPADGLAALLARHLPVLAVAGAGAGGRRAAEAAARRLALRALVDALVHRAGPGHPAAGAALAPALFALAPPVTPDAADRAALAARLERLPTVALATALAALATGATGPPRARGAYATPAALADLMAGWAVRDGATAVLDPACGAGALLARAAAWRAWLGGPPDAPLWGVEADPAAAALARLALAALGATGAVVTAADFLALPPDAPAVVTAVVANPPFVRHERLPADAGTRRRAATVAGLDGRADLHAYFWPSLTARLRPGGRAAVVTPASWLEADYGAPLRRYLLDHYALEAIVEPAAERWFAGVGVHAALVLARRCDDPAARAAARTRLVRLRRPLAELLEPDGPARPPAVAALVARLDALAADADDPDWQARVVPAARLLATGGAAATPRPRSPALVPLPPAAALPWAGWLRAPAVLARLLARDPAAWRRLGDLARVRYPLKSGADGFFYLTTAAAAAWGIEPACLRPLVRTPRELLGLVVEPAALQWRVLALPPEPPEALPPGARRYLAGGVAAGIDRRPTCAARRPWYRLPAPAPAPLLWPRFVHERHAVWLNPAGALENQTFYGVLPVEAELTPALAAVLNSSLGALLMEVCGRCSLGEGALQYAVGQAAAVPVPDVRRADAATRAALAEALRALAATPAWGPLSGPTPGAARLALDDLSLRLLGLADPAERADLAAALRAELARLVAERRQRGAGRPPAADDALPGFNSPIA
jgi:adenine-specific DNA-methyltransferase